MGKRFSLTELAAEKPFVPPAFDTNGTTPTAVTAAPLDDGREPWDSRRLPVESISLNPLNERPAEDDEDIAGLAATLRDYGVIQPLLVCSASAFVKRYPATAKQVGSAHWVVLIGNRRLRAARRAEIETVPVIVNDDQLASMYRAMLIENGQSRAMPPLHEAEAMAKAMKEEKLTQAALATQIGRTQGFVSQRLALLKLVPELRAALAAGELPVELARQLADLPEADQQTIAEGGKPYRARRDAGAGKRRGWTASPARAASAIEKSFTDPDELDELISLLSRRLEELRGSSPLK